MMKCSLSIVLVTSLLGACGAGEDDPADEVSSDLETTGYRVSLTRDTGVLTVGEERHQAGPAVISGAISYHGGALMTGTPNIYLIWYGNWAANAVPKTVLPGFINGLSGSAYEAINARYSTNGHTITGTLHVAGQTTVSTTATRISDRGVRTQVSNAISSGSLPRDANGLYLVLTSANVNESSGFCTAYCGWHTSSTIGGTDIKYGFIGDSSRCPTACQAQSTGPHGTSGADGMASIIAHETEEAISDPDGNAWFDAGGNENADKCAWTFGTTHTSNGALANVTIAGSDWLIQQNWIPTNSGCAMHL